MIGITMYTCNKLVDKLMIKQQNVVSKPALTTITRLPRRRARAEDTGAAEFNNNNDIFKYKMINCEEYKYIVAIFLDKELKQISPGGNHPLYS